MPSASVGGTLGFVVFVGYYLRPVEKYDTKEGVQNFLVSDKFFESICGVAMRDFRAYPKDKR